jgi:hypothetical protein
VRGGGDRGLRRQEGEPTRHEPPGDAGGTLYQFEVAENVNLAVTFTRVPGADSVWFVRYVGNGSEAVQLQSLAFAEPAEEAEVTKALRLYHQQLVGSLSIP